MPEPVSDEFKEALIAATDEHMRQRAEAKVEVRKIGFLRWEWRFYWGRHKQIGNLTAWRDYEEGHALTRQGALFAAARQLTKLQLTDAQWQAAQKREPT